MRHLHSSRMNEVGMVRRACAGLIPWLALGCANASQLPSRDGEAISGTQASAERIAGDFGLPILRLERPDVEREIRVWTLGGGFMIPEPLLRIREHWGRVEGQFFEAWPLPAPDDRTGVRNARLYGLLDEDAWDERAGFMRCRTSRYYRACELQRAASVDWSALLRQLDRLEISRGPAPPGCSRGLDGFHLVVEIRTGSGYRRYECWTPGPETPETARMRQIIDAIRNALFPRAITD